MTRQNADLKDQLANEFKISQSIREKLQSSPCPDYIGHLKIIEEFINCENVSITVKPCSFNAEYFDMIYWNPTAVCYKICLNKKTKKSLFGIFDYNSNKSKEIFKILIQRAPCSIKWFFSIAKRGSRVYHKHLMRESSIDDLNASLLDFVKTEHFSQVLNDLNIRIGE